jgi:hypothetical protein
MDKILTSDIRKLTGYAVVKEFNRIEGFFLSCEFDESEAFRRKVVLELRHYHVTNRARPGEQPCKFTVGQMLGEILNVNRRLVNQFPVYSLFVEGHSALHRFQIFGQFKNLRFGSRLP